MLPLDARLARCRACNALIVWAVTDHAGKRMPVNVDPSPEGNVTLSEGGPRAHVLSAAELVSAVAAGETDWFLSHFATCPNREHFRRRKPSGS